jgi:hypothetical protein
MTPKLGKTELQFLYTAYLLYQHKKFLVAIQSNVLDKKRGGRTHVGKHKSIHGNYVIKIQLYVEFICYL